MSLRLVRESAGDPALDTAVSRVLLERVAAGELPETLRVYRPQAQVAFGRQDAVSPGYAEAVAAARDHGFAAVERLAGGRAAVFHEETVAFAWAVPDPEPRRRTTQRFETLAALVAEALAGLGVDARVGEVPGEYCPGEWSVNAGGRTKLMGVGQRVVRGGAHVGGVIVAADGDRVRDVLLPVYAAMGFEWDPATTGSVADELPGAAYDQVAGALVDAFARHHDLDEAVLDPVTTGAARARRAEFEAPGTTPPSR